MASVNKVILDEQKLMIMYVMHHKSIPEISREICVSQSTVRYRLLKFGVLRTRNEAIKLAAKNGKLGGHLRGKTRIITQQWRDNISIAKKASADLNAKGTRKTPSGYIEFTRGPNKGRALHIVLIEQTIGRKLLPNEVVHHIDKNRENNDISNLQLMTRSEHAKLHAIENYAKRMRLPNGQFE